MNTYILSDAEVAAYARDLVARLDELGDHFPRVWYSIGLSGDKLVRAILAVMDDARKQTIEIRRLGFIRETRKVEDRSGDALPVPEVAFLIDGPVHSGSTMRHVSDWLFTNGAIEVLSYGLVVKRTTEFVPNFFGMMIGEHDRVFFQLDQLPNNRLRRRPPFGVLRALNEQDLGRAQQSLVAGVPSIDKITMADLWYVKASKPRQHVYVYEIAREIVGYVHFYTEDSRVVVDVIAADQRYHGKDIGGLMMRWVENWSRAARIIQIDLFAIAGRVEFYEKLGYIDSGSGELRLSATEHYRKMSRKLLYNINHVYS